MAREIFTKLICDYCKESVTIPSDRPSDPALTKDWVQVAYGDGTIEQFDRNGCAVNRLKTRGIIVLTDSPKPEATDAATQTPSA